MKCPMGSSGDPGAKPPKAFVFFNAKTTFLKQTYRHKIVNIGLRSFSTLGAQTTASKASRPSACARRSQGSRGLAPWQGLQGGSAPLLKKILYFASKICILSDPLWSKLTEIYNLGEGAAKFGELNIHKFGPFLV